MKKIFGLLGVFLAGTVVLSACKVSENNSSDATSTSISTTVKETTSVSSTTANTISASEYQYQIRKIYLKFGTKYLAFAVASGGSTSSVLDEIGELYEASAKVLELKEPEKYKEEHNKLKNYCKKIYSLTKEVLSDNSISYFDKKILNKS